MNTSIGPASFGDLTVWNWIALFWIMSCIVSCNCNSVKFTGCRVVVFFFLVICVCNEACFALDNFLSAYLCSSSTNILNVGLVETYEFFFFFFIRKRLTCKPMKLRKPLWKDFFFFFWLILFAAINM